jgi:DNA-binding MarR family transcriptional regulator
VARSNPQPRRQAKGGHAPSAAPMADEAGVDLGELPDAIGYVLRRVQLAIFDDFIRSLASVDLRPSQFSALVVIDRNPGLKQTQVSEALGIKRANFVALVDELEQRGLARRRQVHGDRRSYALELTEAGQACLRAARALQAKHERRIAARLGPGGREALLKFLQALLDRPLRAGREGER